MGGWSRLWLSWVLMLAGGLSIGLAGCEDVDLREEDALGEAGQALSATTFTRVLRFSLPANLDPADVALAAGSGGLRLNDRTNVRRGSLTAELPSLDTIPVTYLDSMWPEHEWSWQPWVTSLGTTELGAYAHASKLASVGNVTVRNYATVGNLETAGTIELQAGARVGTVVQGQPIVQQEHSFLFEFSASATPATGWVTLNSGAEVFWDADDELGMTAGNVTLNSGSQLTLRAGNYWLRSLAVNSNATLVLDNTKGPIRILIGHPGTTGAADPSAGLTLRGTVERTQEYDENVLIDYVGTNAVPVTTSVYATVIAPHAKVEMYTIFTGQAGYGGGTYEHMTVFANSIELHQSTNFAYSWIEDWKYIPKSYAPMLEKAFRDGEWQCPYAREMSFFEGWQGVTHDDDYWYSSNAQCATSATHWDCHPTESHLWATPVGTRYGGSNAPLGACAAESDPGSVLNCLAVLCSSKSGCTWPLGHPPTMVYNPWASGWDHIGDITYVPQATGLDRVVVPLESDSGNRVALGSLSADFLRVGMVVAKTTGTLPDSPTCPQTHFSWVGYNPTDRLLYSSAHKNISCLNAYQVDWSTGEVSLARTVRLRSWGGQHLRIDTNITGGDFSSSGKLYLALHDPGEEEHGGGIAVVDAATGVVLEGVGFQADTTESDVGDEDEVEGITVWELNDGRAPEMFGEVHVGMLDLDAGTDQFYFKHWRAAIPANL